MAKAAFILPASVSGPAELNQLRRELRDINDFLIQAAIREAGKSVTTPKPSNMMNDVTSQNKLNLLSELDRKLLDTQLERLQSHAPVVHMSFASEAPGAFTQKLVAWWRQEVHPEVLLQVGLQPGIAAGCVVRTPNKYFDFSLRKQFAEQRELLVRSLGDRHV